MLFLTTALLPTDPQSEETEQPKKSVRKIEPRADQLLQAIRLRVRTLLDELFDR